MTLRELLSRWWRRDRRLRVPPEVAEQAAALFVACQDAVTAVRSPDDVWGEIIREHKAAQAEPSAELRRRSAAARRASGLEMG